MNSSEDENGVLYEVVISAEWDTATADQQNSDFREIEEEFGRSRSWVAKVFFPILWIYSWISWIILEYFSRFSIPDFLINSQFAAIPWKLVAVRPYVDDGSATDQVLAAVVTEDTVEIRQSSDEFATSREKFSLKKDHFPVLRKAAWSDDGNCLALADSRGDLTLFDCLNAKSNTINVSKSWTDSSRLLRQRIISSILWIDPPDADQGVLLLHADGTAKLIGRNLDGLPTERWTKNCKIQLPHLMKAISSAAYARDQHIVVLASAINFKVDDDLKNPWFAGLSAWMLTEDDFRPLASDEELAEAQQARVVYKKRIRATDGVIKMAFNGSETALVTLFLSGAIAIWQLSFRELKFRRIWTMEELPFYSQNFQKSVSKSNENFSQKTKNPNFPVDVQWWSDSAIILSQAGGAVSLLDITGRKLVNVSHGSFEQFTPGCVITSNLADKFLILEQNVSGRDRRRGGNLDDSDLTGDDSVNMSEDDENAVSVMEQVLLSMGVSTEKSPKRFIPKKKMGVAYRLNCFQTASPQEMFNRKLAEEQYGEALLLAERFHLDADLVYQKRWMKNKVTKISIVDFLCKVTNSSWVLRECLSRVPDNPDVARELLNVGLRLTDLPSILRLDPGGFSSGDGNGVPNNVDISKLTPEQHAMIGHRRQLLRFETILSSYEQILGGGEKAVRYFLADEYADLRRKSPLEIALQFAHNCKPQDLHTLRYLHHDDLCEFWLDILSNFPETFSPETYQFLIPSVLNGEVLETQHAPPKILDWCQREPFTSVTDQHSIAAENEIEILQSNLIHRGKLSVEKLQKWADERVVEIEQKSGLIDNARQLVHVTTAKHIGGLDSLKDELDTLAALVFEVGQTTISLADLRRLSQRQVLRLLDANKKTKEGFSVAFRERMLPYLKRCDRLESGSRFVLLEDYLTETSADPQQNLEKCLKVLQQSLPGIPDPAIPLSADAVDLATKCILVCPRTDQLEQMKAILQCLPSREDFPEGVALDFQKISRINDLISCIEFAERFGVQLSVKNLREVQSSDTLSVEFVSHLLRIASQKIPGFTELEWREIYAHFIKICKKVFTSLSDEKAVELFANSLLMSGKIQYIDLALKFFPVTSKTATISPKNLAGEVWSVPNRLSSDTSFRLLLAAGKDYFVSSDDWKDPKMKLAEKCFDFASGLENASVGVAKLELGLVGGVKELHKLGVEASPLDIRTTPDRFKFIRNVLDVKSDAYKHPELLRELATMLDVKDLNRVAEAVAEKAFDKHDFGFCRDLCEKLIEQNHTSSWALCVKLAAAEGFSDIVFKDKILLFALVNCPKENLSEVVELRNRVNLKRLRMKTSQSLTENISWEPLGKLPIDSCFVASSSSAFSNRTKISSIDSMVKNLDSLKENSDLISEKNLGNFFSEEKNRKNSEFDEILIHSALSSLLFDAGSALFSLGALKTKSNAENFFESVPPTPVLDLLAAYFYGLEICFSRETNPENLYRLSCQQVLAKARNTPSPDQTTVKLLDLLKKYGSRAEKKTPATAVAPPATLPKVENSQKIVEKSSKNSENSQKNSENSAPIFSTKSIRSVLKGVDETKFQTNFDFRKSFLVRAAATKDSDVLRDVVQIAEENGVEGWEVVASNIKFLFTTSGLSVSHVEAFLKKIPDLVDRLKKKKADFIRYSSLQIQPQMTNADMFLLEIYSDFLSEIKKP